MTLEDFFTLTEMNNGLAAPSRVRELVAVMQKESDYAVKNIGEATRQWHAVASAIAATENQECLDLFIQLDGLQFIVKWLKDAQSYGNDSNDDFVEESITHMLRALGKLHVGYEKLVDSEMWTTVKDLLVHSSSKVQDKARVLFDSWKVKKDGDASLSNVENLEALRDGEVSKSADSRSGSAHSESSQSDLLSRETSSKAKDQESTRDDPVLSASSDTADPGQAEKPQDLDKKTNPAAGDDTPSDHVGSPSLLNPGIRLPTSHSMDATLTKSCNLAVSGQETLGSGINIHELLPASDVKHDLKVESSLGKLESAEELNTSESKSFPSSSGAADIMRSVPEPSLPKDSVAGHTELCKQDSASIELRTIDSNGKGSVENTFSASQCGSSCASDVGDELKGPKLSESPGGIRSWESSKGFGAFLAGIMDHGEINKHGQHKSDVNLTNDYKFAKNVEDREAVQVREKSDTELLAIVDPLEMVRQVAIEVQREVVGYREQSGSVSEKQKDSNAQRSGSPDSVSGRQSHASKNSSKDVSSDPELSDEASPMQEESATSSKSLDAEQTDGIQTATSQVTEATQDDNNTEKDLCNFDLNQELNLEDADHPRNQLSTPISVVSASRAAAAAAPGLPVAPLQFEGNHGWKGSAATSAFRPASPRRMPENEKDLYAGGNGSSSKRQVCLDIDLNVAECVDDRTEDKTPDASVPLFSTFLPGESSVGTNAKSAQLELDLNHTSEDGSRPFMRQFFPNGNGFDSQSHATSSKLPSLKNIDLNDQPSFLKESSGNAYSSKLSQNLNVSGDLKSDSSVISIMGTRVEVNREGSASQTVALPNGRTSDLAFDVHSGRTGSFLGVLPYTHSSVYGYNNAAPSPVMPFSSPMYGSGAPIPYMVDSRGTPVIPQIVGSTLAMPTGFSQTPFSMNMSTPSPSNVRAVGPSRSNFDLNSGTMIEGGSRDHPAGFTQFLNLGPVKSMEDNSRYNPQTPFSSVLGGKRKEPDNGWEHYPVRHYTPPWK